MRPSSTFNPENYDGFYNYAHSRWTGSETIRYVREHRIGGWINSNVPVAIYIHTDGSAEHRSLPLLERLLVQHMERQQATADDVHIVWFYGYRVNRGHDYGIPEIEALPNVERVADLSDGAVFRLTPKVSRFDLDIYRVGKERHISKTIEAD